MDYSLLQGTVNKDNLQAVPEIRIDVFISIGKSLASFVFSDPVLAVGTTVSRNYGKVVKNVFKGTLIHP